MGPMGYAVVDERWNGLDALARPEALVLATVGCIAAIFERRGGLGFVEPSILRRVQQAWVRY